MRKPFLWAILIVPLTLVFLVALFTADRRPGFGIWGQANRQPGGVLQREGLPPVVSYDARDARMNRAVQEARDTLAGFLRVLADPAPQFSDFAVKCKFPTGEYDEHLWIEPVAWRDGQLVGQVGNNPVHATWLHYGDEITVDRDTITDWKYLDNGLLIGGYTMRAMSDDVSPEDARQYGMRPDVP